MIKKLARPIWYNENFYNKERTPEEWLYEIWKRDAFNCDKIGLAHSIYKLPISEQGEYFIKFIFAEELENFLDHLEPTPPEPIKNLSVSDVFIMYHLLTNSDWYKKNSNRDEFEKSIPSIINNKTLTKEHKIAFHEMYKTPWCVFYENHKQDSWCPKKEMEYLTGIPISLDPVYAKEGTIKILKKKLNASVGKIQDIQAQFKRWEESKILAVFDLRLWFKIQGIKFTKIGIHKLIWPNGRVSTATSEEVNPYDDIDHSISLVNRIIDRNVVSSLLTFCEAKKFKNEISTV